MELKLPRNYEKKISQKYCVHTIEFWKLTQSNNSIFSSIESKMIHPSFLEGIVLADQCADLLFVHFHPVFNFPIHS